MDRLTPYEYVYSGTLSIDSPTYTIRKADTDLYEGLKAGKFCYVFNSRKTGKSSLRVQIMRRLQNDGIACAAIDLSMGGNNYTTPDQWYADIIDTLVDIFNLDIDLDSWWSKQQLLSPVKRFSKFIETILLVQLSQNNQKIVIFIDEIDSLLSLKFGSDDFFALIRACYNQRADNPIYNNLTFCLLGVATPPDLMSDKTRTPFNIGQAIELTGFTLEEAKPSLMPGFVGKVDNPEIVLQLVLNWTGGQPFLTQKVCSLVQANTDSCQNDEAQWVEEIVKTRIINNWESQDEPEHLRTILNRIIDEKNEKSRSRLLEYQRILLSIDTNNRRQVVVVDESTEQVELQLSGLVVKSNAILKVYNRIYESVFDCNWVEKELAKLRPLADSVEVNLELEKIGADILRKATEKANRRVQIGSIILLSLFLLSLFGVKQAEHERQNVLIATKIKKNATNALRKFSSREQKQVFTLTGHKSAVKSVVYSPDGKTLASASDDGTIKFWDISTGKLIYTLTGHKFAVNSIVYSPDGKTLATGSDDGTIKLWNLCLDSLLAKELCP